MSLRARGLPLLLVFLAACPARTRRVGEVSGPPEPPAVSIRPLEAADLTQNPRRGLVLGAGGPGHARPMRLIGGAHWLSVAAPLADDNATGWSSFWLIARPKRGASPDAAPAPGQETGPTVDSEAPPAPDPDAGPGSTQRPFRPRVPPSGPALAGSGWERALWIARLTASRAFGKSPLAFEVSAVSRGDEVEPPGTATISVAALAAVTGATLRRSAVVIAELEPDGSLAPVDDPVVQVQEAMRRGARRVVLPLGGGTATPAGAAQPVDLMALVRRSGGAVWLAPDLTRAYRSLTGAILPEPDAAGDRDLALAAVEREALQRAYRRALERLAPSWPKLLEQQNRARQAPPLAALVAAVERGARRAERWRAAGDQVAAYVQLAEAAALADAALRLEQILRLVADGELERAREELDAAHVAPEVARLVPPGNAAPVAIGDHLRATGVFALAATSWAWSEEAAARARPARAALAALSSVPRDRMSSRATARKAAEAVAPLLVASAHARLQAELATDRAGFERGGGPGFSADDESLRALAAADAAAAAAALEQLDALAQPASAESGPAAPGDAPSPGSAIPDAVAARRMLELVDATGDLTRGSGRARVSPERSPLLALAIARHAFERTGDALARARRLRPQLNHWTGQVASVGRPSRLRTALTLAEAAARRQATAARVAIGSIPLGARLAFQAARSLSRGDRAERFKAVELFQTASAECRLAVLVALSESVAPTSAAGSVAARGGCPPSPSARRACR